MRKTEKHEMEKAQGVITESSMRGVQESTIHECFSHSFDQIRDNKRDTCQMNLV